MIIAEEFERLRGMEEKDYRGGKGEGDGREGGDHRGGRGEWKYY